MAKKNVKITNRARKAFENWKEYFSENIANYHRMFQFVYGRQWEEEEEHILRSYNKPPLTFNKLATLINTMIGEQQQNTPQLQVVPLDSADYETVKQRELIIKNLSLSNRAKTSYQVAAKQAFVGGYGAFLVDTDYTHAKSFDQDIVVKYFLNATSSYWDQSAEEIDKTDGMHCGYVTRYSRKKFRELWGRGVEQKVGEHSQKTSGDDDVIINEASKTSGEFNWSDESSITVLDHFEKKYRSETIYRLSNGRVVEEEELKDIIGRSKRINEELMAQQEQQILMQQQQMMQQDTQDMAQQPEQPMDGMGQEVLDSSEIQQQQQQPETEIPEDLEDDDRLTLYDGDEPIRIEDKKVHKRPYIKHYRIAGEYILDSTDFPGEYLPLVFVDQNSYYDEHGKQITVSFLQYAIDAQRYLNYLGTQSAYILKVSRYDQFMGSKENVRSQDTQNMWRNPSAQQGMLIYDESPNGNRPEPLKPPELSQSLMQQYERAMNDLYTSTGLYESRMGQQGNETSGAAIDARTRQGSYPTYVPFNSINRSIESSGRIINKMIPDIYDAERIMSLESSDGVETITLNKQLDEYGERIENDVRRGTYEVKLRPGPSYEGQKEQALESLNMVLQANPQLLNLIADLYAENLPLANNIELKNRLKTIVPQDILEAGRTGKPIPQSNQQQPDPEEMKLQAEQQKQQMDAQLKQQELQIKQHELQLKAQKMQVDMEMEQQKLEQERAEIAAQLEEQKLRYMGETHRTNTDAAVSHADNITKILTHGFGQQE